jgi:hypothetical protein
MANLNGFDASTVDPTSSFDPIPAGEYVARIAESEMKATKSGNGQYLQLTIEVCDGRYKGRKLWARLNLDNPNQEAVEIARRELSQICHAVGVMKPRDSAELHGTPLAIKVTCKADKNTGEMQNEIKGYAKYSGAAPVSAPVAKPGAPAGTPPPSPAAPVGGPAPWARK